MASVLKLLWTAYKSMEIKSFILLYTREEKILQVLMAHNYNRWIHRITTSFFPIYQKKLLSIFDHECINHLIILVGFNSTIYKNQILWLKMSRATVIFIKFQILKYYDLFNKVKYKNRINRKLISIFQFYNNNGTIFLSFA